MTDRISIDSVRRVRVQLRTFLAFVISAVFVLSIFHHIVNFWALSGIVQLLILAMIPLLAVLINFLAGPIWERAVSTSWKRWLLFLLPALLIVSYATWRVFESPHLQHSIEITARENSGRKQAQLLEIRDSNGAVVPFSKIEQLGDWTLQNKSLTAGGPRPIRYSFTGPLRDPVKFRFLTSPASGDVEIKVDHQSLQISLFDNANGQRVVQLNPTYRLGIPGTAMIVLVIAIDFLALLGLCTILWLIQEVHQTVQPPIKGADNFSRKEYQKWLMILLVIAFVLHAANYLAVPLFFGEDSPGYIEGAVHWAKYHNFDGASSARGPGTSILFLPAMVLFGRNPWGLKLLLHLLAYASVPLAYHLGWQLTRKYGFAFLAGLVTVLTPDIMLYSNIVMSEVPNIFIVLLFCVLLLTTLESTSSRSILATMLVASFATLIRTENILLMVIAAVFLSIKMVQRWLVQREINPATKLFPEAAVYVKQLGFAILLAVLPLLWWSAHNYRLHGFFGLSNYASEVFYTGWVYGGEASRIPITDQSSPAVQTIKDVYFSDPVNANNPQVPTGWMIYFYLTKHGFSSEEAFSLLRQAAIDSITNDYRTTWRVVVVKIRDTFKTEPNGMVTFPLPGEPASINRIKAPFYDEEQFVIPSLVVMHRQAYEFLAWYYIRAYPIWAWFCAGAMLFCLYRKPVIPWLPIVLITLFRVGLPNIFGLSNWRFVVSGLPLMQILALAALQSMYLFAIMMFHTYKNGVAYRFSAK